MSGYYYFFFVSFLFIYFHEKFLDENVLQIYLWKNDTIIKMEMKRMRLDLNKKKMKYVLVKLNAAEKHYKLLFLY